MLITKFACLLLLSFLFFNSIDPNVNITAPLSKKLQNHTKIENSIGLVALDEYSDNDSIKIYNEDGSLWYSFSFYYDENVRFNKKREFNPYAFHIDYFLLVFKCIEKENDFYKVLVNDNTIKYLKLNDKTIKFFTWEDFLLNYDLSIDIMKGDLYQEKNIESRVINNRDSKKDEVLFFEPIMIEEDWLKVKWTTKKEKKMKGWLKWKNGNKLLIGFNLI